jgi:uncharacterized protein (TIGR02246 family)
MHEQVEAIAHTINSQLEEAWNAANSTAFAASFAVDADFVDIRGDYHHGRDEIDQGHHSILSTIYKGSTVHYELLQARRLTADVILAHTRAELQVPAGPLAGTMHALYSLVLLRDGDTWQIAGFHNAPVRS